MTRTDPARIVAIGGGHGLAACLRAARLLTPEVVGVVSTADDGGSTGRLRATDPARPAPGDLRKCLVALAAPDTLLRRALEHRFSDGELAGHAFGNLLITALAETGGDLVDALDEIGRLLACTGRVVPATCVPVTLRGHCRDGATVAGQATLTRVEGIERVTLDPAAPPATPAALEAIARADLVVVAPGSLYTSVLAALAVPELAEAVAARAERLVYVCNLHPQPGETTGYTVADHVAALARAGVRPAAVLYDPATIEFGESAPHGCSGATEAPRPVPAPLAASGGRRHDDRLLADALARLSG